MGAGTHGDKGRGTWRAPRAGGRGDWDVVGVGDVEVWDKEVMETGDMLNYLGPPFNEPDFNPPRLARAERGHFCPSLQGLVLSIAGVMSSLGYPLPVGPPAGPPVALAASNDFLKKMDDFWLLKELQTWLWRSAKDFNRLKKKVPPAVVTFRLEARGF
ncbi:PREDICTED: cardiotrophin-like cytokine factor 1 [Chaetura pelagica]|uniref:cardiotrophin-like cytokine factor 1 n=1 Tax=Chaetura pelagica TaxID=8897 RepID=UPI000523637F|nr:PREDICTED: cardiotrophin-like cytokine factor 1 [Chaetura pelagica]